jgi:signal transduction histidine kinase
LLIAAIFFVSHTIIINERFNVFSQRVDLWWHIGWWPVIALPLAWYVITLWYAGYWDSSTSALHRRQRTGLAFTLALAIILAGMLIVANPLPSLAVNLRYEFAATPLIGGVPIIIITYPLYIFVCISLSFDALLRPGPSERMMGDIARSRARPWLLTTAVLLLIVSLLVAWVMYWITTNANNDLVTITYTLSVIDLIVATMIGIAILCVGQAIVVYEVFTGKALPRHGLQRHWRRAILLALGFGVVVGAGLTFEISPIYLLLSITLMMTVFFALLSWRIFSEREHYMRQLRPFVASQRLYDHLLTPSGTDAVPALPSEADVVAPLRALCWDVLNARQIVLAAVGPLAPLVGPAVSDSGQHPQLPPLTDITSKLTSPQTMCLPLDPAQYGAQWAVPLWSERGLIGLLLLGEKFDGGLYTQEEIELARASGERLIDTRASAEMARRLMSLQRERLAESQVLDRRARRTLHDDVLPQLHAAMLGMNSGSEKPETISLLTNVHRQISDLLHDMPAAPPDVARTGLLGALRHIANGELADSFDAVSWHIDPEAERRLNNLPPLTAEVVFYAAREAMRNAAKYGRGADSQWPLKLELSVVWADGVKIAVEDNGVGVAQSNGNGSNGGSGRGLALHSTMMAVIGGTLAVEDNPRSGTRVVLYAPMGM